MASFQKVALGRPQFNPTPAYTKTTTNPDQGACPFVAQPKAALMLLLLFRLSGFGFVFVFVSVGVRLICGLPNATFWKEATCKKRAV